MWGKITQNYLCFMTSFTLDFLLYSAKPKLKKKKKNEEERRVFQVSVFRFFEVYRLKHFKIFII